MGIGQLHFLVRDLARRIGLGQIGRGAAAGVTGRRSRRSPDRQAVNLRPPTLMIDLLFGALMLFAFQIGVPAGDAVVSHQLELPTAESDKDSKPHALLALVPVARESGDWSYTTPDGNSLAARQIKAFADEKGVTPVLMVPKNMPVQAFIDAEQPLRELGLTVGLAAINPKGDKE